MNDSFIYFVITKDKSAIRIGYTGNNKSDRTEDHASYGCSLLAKLPATGINEKSLHAYFSAHLLEYGASTSFYLKEAVMPYVEQLIERGFACSDPEHAKVLPRVPWNLWSPAAVSKPLVYDKQYLMFLTEAKEAHERDTWQTPKEIIALCREALGGVIDLDPASSAIANLRVGATYFHTEKSDGLRHKWDGTVFLNPPYGGDQGDGARLFTRKLIQEFTSGSVTKAITVLNLQSVPTLWFPQVATHAACHAIWKKRIQFIGPAPKSGKGTKYGASKNGTIFSYFGNSTEAFKRLFSPHAYVFELIRA